MQGGLNALGNTEKKNQKLFRGIWEMRGALEPNGKEIFYENKCNNF